MAPAGTAAQPTKWEPEARRRPPGREGHGSVTSAPRPDGLVAHRIRGRRQPSFPCSDAPTSSTSARRAPAHARALRPPKNTKLEIYDAVPLSPAVVAGRRALADQVS